MAWLVICHDIDDAEKAQGIRTSKTSAHLAYVETVLGKIDVAGPLSDAEGGDFHASAFIYKTDTRSEAEALLHGDPYFEAGLYKKTTIQYFLPAAGNWVGGKTW